MPSDAERIGAALGPRAARRYRAATSIEQTTIGDYAQRGGAMAR